MNFEIGAIGATTEYERRTGTLFHFARLNGVNATNDVLARAASKNRFTADELIAVIKTLHASGAHAQLGELLDGFERLPFLDLITVLADQAARPADAFDARKVLEAIVRSGRAGKLRNGDKFLLLELLAQAREADLVAEYSALLGIERLDRVQSRLLAANAIRPHSGGEQADDLAAWLDTVNQVFEWDDLEPIAIAPGSEPLMDRIVAAASSIVESGPLVTVIVPTFRPDARIFTAIESLLSQSYRSLEILVMDDASGPASAPIFERISARDARVKVVHLETNLGTYHARNVAVQFHATGDLITVHDDDDWSHPRKIELQVAHLLAEPDVPANMSLLVRATSGLEFSRINDNPVLTQRNYSSLMMRRSVVEAIGYWDEVNRAADAEMYDRIMTWWGQKVPVVGRVPTSFLRVRGTSLTSGEIARGYLDPRRRWYVGSYQRWHQDCADRGVTPYRAAGRPADRDFSAPVSLLGSRQANACTAVDVLYATDFRFPGGNSTLACNEIEILLDHGFTVGLLQLDSPILGQANRLHVRALRAALHPSARVVSTRDEVHAGLTIVRHPTVLQYARPIRSRVQSERVVVIVNHAPFDVDRTGSHYDISAVVNNCQAIFGVTPIIAPEAGVVRSLLAGLVDESLLSPQDWSGIVDLELGAPRCSVPARPFVVGRHSRDHLFKWPLAEILGEVYPTDGSMDVRVLGGADSLTRRGLDPDALPWTIYPFGSKPVAEFLSELDFWIYFHGPELHESFGMAALEAMAAGLVVVLPHYMSATFGSGAVYAEPSGVSSLLARYWNNPSDYEAQSARAIEAVGRRFGADALLRRVAGLLPFPATGQRVVDVEEVL